MGTALLKKENKKIWEISEIFSVKKNLLKSETKKEIFKMSEEVKEEIEALMSIYEEDMQVLSESPNYVISMHVRSMNDIEDCPTLTLRITYPGRGSYMLRRPSWGLLLRFHDFFFN